MHELIQKNPSELLAEGEDPIHTIEIHNEDGDVLARAEIDYFSSPIPYYQLSDLFTEEAFQHQGLASQLLDAFEAKLRRTGRAGFLVDGIMPGTGAEGMYARRGWIPVPGGRSQFVYNLPKGIGPEKFIGVEMRSWQPDEE